MGDAANPNQKGNMMTNAREEKREALLKAFRETMSPQAVALVASGCHATAGNLPDTPEAREVAWLGDELIDMLGSAVYLALLDGAMDDDAREGA